jgi:hypothetical protein
VHHRTTWLLNTVAGAGKPCLLVGESGTAKTVTLSRWLASLDPSATAMLGLNFSSRTSSLDVQRAIEDCVEKRTKVLLPGTTTCIAGMACLCIRGELAACSMPPPHHLLLVASSSSLLQSHVLPHMIICARDN